jgi:hypothetical protein
VKCLSGCPNGDKRDAELTIHRAVFCALLKEMEIRLETRLLAKLGSLLEEVLDTKLEEKLGGKLRPAYAMGVLIVMMQTVTLTKRFL